MKPEFQPCLTVQSEESEGDDGRDVMWGAEGKKTVAVLERILISRY